MFECASGASEHCAGEDLFDPAYRDEDGAAICIACAIALGLHDPETDRPAAERPEGGREHHNLNLYLQQMHDVEVTIEPSEKYWRTTEGYADPENDATNEAEWNDWPDEHKQAADAYCETVANTPTPDDLDIDLADLSPLTWEDISVASDPDLVAKIATYFEGMTSDEPTGRLRAKLRLLDVEVYSNAQMAARAELRDQ